MPKWIENWLKSRKQAHILISRLMQWQTKRQAEKIAKRALKALEKNRRPV